MRPADLFKFCPRCAAGRPADNAGQVPYRCSACGLLFFFNPTVAAAAYVFDGHGRALFIRREAEPAKGKLAIPGGFVDIGETHEEALRREVREEVGLEVEAIAFLGSFPNEYPYRDVTYPVLDLVFTATAVAPEKARALDAVAGLEWRTPAEVDPGELAFPSIRETIRLLAGRGAR